MELLFNILWVLVAGGICGFAASDRNSRVRPQRSFTVLVAIACVAVLLFPAISLSDDLQQLALSVESPQQYLAMLHIQQLPGIRSASLDGALDLQLARDCALWKSSGNTSVQAFDGYTSPSEGRSPPPTGSSSSV